jgi:hypothetical protein
MQDLTQQARMNQNTNLEGFKLINKALEGTDLKCRIFYDSFNDSYYWEHNQIRCDPFDNVYDAIAGLIWHIQALANSKTEDDLTRSMYTPQEFIETRKKEHFAVFNKISRALDSTAVDSAINYDSSTDQFHWRHKRITSDGYFNIYETIAGLVFHLESYEVSTKELTFFDSEFIKALVDALRTTGFSLEYDSTHNTYSWTHLDQDTRLGTFIDLIPGIREVLKYCNSEIKKTQNTQKTFEKLADTERKLTSQEAYIRKLELQNADLSARNEELRRINDVIIKSLSNKALDTF